MLFTLAVKGHVDGGMGSVDVRLDTMTALVRFVVDVANRDDGTGDMEALRVSIATWQANHSVLSERIDRLEHEKAGLSARSSELEVLWTRAMIDQQRESAEQLARVQAANATALREANERALETEARWGERLASQRRETGLELHKAQSDVVAATDAKLERHAQAAREQYEVGRLAGSAEVQAQLDDAREQLLDRARTTAEEIQRGWLTDG